MHLTAYYLPQLNSVCRHGKAVNRNTNISEGTHKSTFLPVDDAQKDKKKSNFFSLFFFFAVAFDNSNKPKRLKGDRCMEI